MRVSVILPVYNKAKYIAVCLRSLLRQTHDEIDILVFDDGSRDDSRGIIDTFRDRRISVFGDGKNHGVSYARNRLIEAARTKVVVLQDADDFSHYDRIGTQLHAMMKFCAPRVRCRKLYQWEMERREREWLNGPLYPVGPPKAQTPTSGVFCSEMFIRHPMVLFREDLRVCEERMWVSDMRVVWGGELNIAKRLYGKRVVIGQDAMSSWVYSEKHSADVKHARVTYKKRRSLRMPDLAKIRETADGVKRTLIDGTFWCE